MTIRVVDREERKIRSIFYTKAFGIFSSECNFSTAKKICSVYQINST